MGRAPLPELPIFEPVFDGFRHEAATFSRDSFQQEWYQDSRKLRQVKTSKAFIWPKDGKNGSSWGRLKDVFQNKGPDMYIAFGARSTDCVSNRPSRSQWAGHTQLDDRGMKYTFNSQKFAPWTKSHMLGGREHGLSYDFRTRKHSRPDRWMWTDAIWQQEPYKNRKANNYPEALRTMSGLWWQDTQYLPEYLGGCVDNEFGIGLPFYHLD